MFAAIFAAVVREGFPGINLVNYSYTVRYKYRYLPLYLSKARAFKMKF